MNNEKKSNTDQDVYEARRRKRRFRLIVILIMLVVILTTVNIGVSVFLYTGTIKDNRIKTVSGITRQIAYFIDTDKVDEYISKGRDVPGYKETEDILYNIFNNSAEIKYLYVLKITPEGCCIVFDMETEDNDAYTPGEMIAFEEAFLPYLPELYAGKDIEPIESNDVTGWVITDYSPVYDKNGNCVCYVGADISMTDVSENVHEFLIKISLSCALILLLILLVALKLSNDFNKISNWEELKKKEEQNKLLIREIVTAFSKAVDMKDKYTNGHSIRVAKYTAMLAKELGLDDETVEQYYDIALMHDVGKIGVPEDVLNKPGKLTDEEFEAIKSHTTMGYNALKEISVMPELAIGAASHHERPDGKGYPKGLKGDEIPRVAQVIAVADTFDAMYSNRPYRKRMNFDKAVSIIKEVSGTQLASDVVDAFLRLADKGAFRSSDNDSDESTENINNIRQKYDDEK